MGYVNADAGEIRAPLADVHGIGGDVFLDPAWQSAAGGHLSEVVLHTLGVLVSLIGMEAKRASHRSARSSQGGLDRRSGLMGVRLLLTGAGGLYAVTGSATVTLGSSILAVALAAVLTRSEQQT